MAKKKVCKKCKLFVKGNECPNCHGTDFYTTWKGRIIILDPAKSEIAKKMGVDKVGEYAIRVR